MHVCDVHTYVPLLTCVNTCASVHACMMCECTGIHSGACVCKWLCAHMYVHTHICVCAHVCACMPVCTHVHILLSTHVHAYVDCSISLPHSAQGTSVVTLASSFSYQLNGKYLGHSLLPWSSCSSSEECHIYLLAPPMRSFPTFQKMSAFSSFFPTHLTFANITKVSPYFPHHLVPAIAL